MAEYEKQTMPKAAIQSIDRPSSNADEALGIFEEVKEGHIEEVIDDKKLLWKIDLRLMPLLYAWSITSIAQAMYVRG